MPSDATLTNTTDSPSRGFCYEMEQYHEFDRGISVLMSVQFGIIMHGSSILCCLGLMTGVADLLRRRGNNKSSNTQGRVVLLPAIANDTRGLPLIT